MGERIFSKDEGIGVGKRSVKVDSPESWSAVEHHPYDPSRTEILLEEIARSFGTELGEAYLNRDNGTKLVRLSRPLVLTHSSTGERSLLAMQYTRFSPFLLDRETIIRVHKEKTPRDKRKSPEKVMELIGTAIEEKDGSNWDATREVTDTMFIPNIPIVRWRKHFYFAVFRLDSKEDLPEDAQPFTIHEEIVYGRRPSDIHITFTREPLFVSSPGFGGVRNDLKSPDSLRFSFPKIYSKHREAISSTNTLHSSERREVVGERGVTYEIPSSESSTLTMASIQAYLKKMCVGVTL